MAVTAAPCEERDGRSEDGRPPLVGTSSTTPARRVRFSPDTSPGPTSKCSRGRLRRRGPRPEPFPSEPTLARRIRKELARRLQPVEPLVDPASWLTKWPAIAAVAAGDRPQGCEPPGRADLDIFRYGH